MFYVSCIHSLSYFQDEFFGVIFDSSLSAPQFHILNQLPFIRSFIFFSQSSPFKKKNVHSLAPIWVLITLFLNSCANSLLSDLPILVSLTSLMHPTQSCQLICFKPPFASFLPSTVFP